MKENAEILVEAEKLRKVKAELTDLHKSWNSNR